MRILALSFSVWTLLELLTLGHTAPYADFAFPIGDSLVHNYSRFTEIKNHCNPYISSASELESDDGKVASLKNELSFFNGDWVQDSGGATLMPFDDSDVPWGRSSFISPWKLVSFEVKNIISGAPHEPKNTFSISGVLSIGITRHSTLISEPNSKFHKRPGMSALRVDFEGVYLETEKNGGERLVCLLGNSTFPFRKLSDGFSDHDMTSYFAVTDTYNEEPTILPHDQILLVLRYPKTFSLSTRGIHGELTSLNENNDFGKYFNKVHITSQLGIFSNYQFGSSEKLKLMLESFDQNPLHDAMVEDGVKKFNNSEFCTVLKYFKHEAYQVMPNLKLGGQNAFQDTVGPFLLRDEIQLVDRNNENLRVILQDVRCNEEKVSGVLRLYPVRIEPYIAARRTGLSSLTLSLEGTWNSSTGLLSMIGCLASKLVRCDSAVILYFPESFSIKQRSVVCGSIFSLQNMKKLYEPVFIGIEMLSPGLRDNGWYSKSHLSYNYSKTGSAIKFRERSLEPKLLTYIKKSLFRYPALEKDAVFQSLNSLSDDLTIDTLSSFDTFVKLEVLSLGSLVRTHDSDSLNISLNLLLIEAPVKVKEKYYRHVSKVYLEGIYDQHVGKLYLIGCRKVDFDHVDLERGLDCLIEVTIEYSPENTRWLINPTASVSIVSQRNDDDSYQFTPVHLRTFMIRDRNHEKNVIFRKIFEGYLRVLLFLVFVTLISYQLKHMKRSPNLVPYISLVMLSVWIFGYGFNLISGNEIEITSFESQYYMNQPYDYQSYKLYLNALDYLARFLVLVSLFLMAWISGMVLRARKALRDQGESSPSDKKVFLVSSSIYVCYLLVRIIERGLSLKLMQGNLTKDVYMKEIVGVFRYEFRVIKDYFLIPQIIANHIWRPHGFGALRTSFFNGLLWIPLLVQFFYGIIRDPIMYPGYANVS